MNPKTKTEVFAAQWRNHYLKPQAEGILKAMMALRELAPETLHVGGPHSKTQAWWHDHESPYSTGLKILKDQYFGINQEIRENEYIIEQAA